MKLRPCLALPLTALVAASASAGLKNGPGLSSLGDADIWGGYATMKPSLVESVASNHYITFTVQAADNGGQHQPDRPCVERPDGQREQLRA